MDTLSTATHINYPFRDAQTNGDILAYWYNIPPDSITMRPSGNTIDFYSTLEVYGRTPTDAFEVAVGVYTQHGDEVLTRSFQVAQGQEVESYSVDFSGDYFRLIYPVECLDHPPDMIIVTVRDGQAERTQEIPCRYHRLFGTVTDFDGNPFRAAVSIRPDGFRHTMSVWTDASGHYEVQLPERTYNSIFVDDESYTVDTLEAWGWHIIMDADQRLDFKVGTGEVYNMSVWPNNGGYPTYFISFRPMVMVNNPREYRLTLNNTERKVTNIAPDLDISDIRVTVNGREAEIVSVQRYYETGSERMMPAYLVQIDRTDLDRVGKLTVMLEYQKEMEVGGEKVIRNSMGYYQCYLNFFGLSPY